MEIIINQTIKCEETWEPKTWRVILVKKESDIEPLWKLLVEQESYWESYKKLIIVPPVLDSQGHLDFLCDYCGKTDIYDYNDLKRKAAEQGIEFLIYSTTNI